MTAERDDYDVFLDSWEPGPLLKHAILAPNINDPLALRRLLEDSTGEAGHARTGFAPGLKVMDDQEKRLRGYAFLENRQPIWSAHFRDHVLNAGVDRKKLDLFITGFATFWIDGRSRRQDSPEMIAIKASIRDYDRLCHPEHANLYVLNPVDDNVAALFSPQEMAAVLAANQALLEAFIPDYLNHLGDGGTDSINDLYVRRGAYMPEPSDFRNELHQLSSYSLALGPVEQFAQTWTPQSRAGGVPSIFAAPLPAVQDRVIAFAPFIEGMDISQLELVVAPPVAPTPLRHLGEHGGIQEFVFD
jgi:hypothetical protein